VSAVGYRLELGFEPFHAPDGTTGDESLARHTSKRQALGVVRFSFVTALFVFVSTLLFVCAPARADSSDPSLAPVLGRLAAHAEKFEKMKKEGSYTFNGRVNELDGSGKASSTKEMVLDVKAQTGGADPIAEIVTYREDGQDKTTEAREKAKKRKAEGKKPSGRKMRDFHLPFLSGEQSRYTFTLAERNASDSNLVRIAFVPKTVAEDAYKGSAWVDEKAGEVISLGFSLSKNPTFIDHVDVTVEFGHATTLGRAPSKIAFEAKGGFLVIKKHYKGSATITNARIGP
jgi:hypothetical protein